MLWTSIMALLILWLLGYGYKVGGNAIHLLVAAVGALLVITLFRANATTCYRRQMPMKGKIRWFNPEKQWGFIACDDGHDVSFEGSSVDSSREEALYEGETVEFTVEQPAVSVAKHVVRIQVQAKTSSVRQQ